MERSEYYPPNQTNILTQSFPGASSSDTVSVTIYDVNDAAEDISRAAMTFVTGVTWRYNWSSPNQTNTYIVDFWNETLDVHYYLYARLSSSIASAPTGSVTGSSLSTLRTNFLISKADMYDANDLTGTASAGDRADRCINQALQKIYSMVSDTRYLEANPGSLSSVADQEYIELSGISDLRQIKSIVEATNDLKLVRIPFWQYRIWSPDPSNVTGTPTHYARLFNRIYLFPRPTSAITYTVDYEKTISDLSSDSDQAGVPAKYNYWILAEAHYFWQLMIDPSDTAAMSVIIAAASDAREQALRDIYAEYEGELVSESRWGVDDTEPHHLWDSPANQ